MSNAIPPPLPFCMNQCFLQQFITATKEVISHRQGIERTISCLFCPCSSKLSTKLLYANASAFAGSCESQVFCKWDEDMKPKSARPLQVDWLIHLTLSVILKRPFWRILVCIFWAPPLNEDSSVCRWLGCVDLALLQLWGVLLWFLENKLMIAVLTNHLLSLTGISLSCGVKKLWNTHKKY